jgi:serine/threonine-protein kinase
MGKRRARLPLEVAPAPVRAQAGVLASLRERKVVQWTLAYAAAAFALLQVLTLVSQAFAWPEWLVRAGIVVATLGAVVTAVVSWYHGDRGVQRVTGTELLILAVLLYLGSAWLWQLRRPAPATPSPTFAPAPQPATRAVVAVLPFDNLGAESDQGMVDGLHDETISRLATLDAFAVISRTSTLSYRNSRPNLRSIASELGATHVLEGTVHRDGNRIRLRVQFIEAASDAHLFARTIDRDAGSLFEAQALLAAEIAEALRARLQPEVLARMQRQPTASAEAYLAYLVARQGWLDLAPDAQLANADAALDRALALDPAFLEALALRAVLDAEMLFNGDQPDVRAPRARNAQARLTQLAPDHPLAWLAEGKVLYHIDRDYARARPLLAKAAAAMPNDPVAINGMAWIEHRLGHAAAATAWFERMRQVDPLNVRTHQNLMLHYEGMREYAQWLAVCRHLADRYPADPQWRFQQGRAIRAATGDDGAMRAAYLQYRSTSLSPMLELGLLFNAGDWPGLVRFLESNPEVMRPTVGAIPPSDLFSAMARWRMGDPAGARQAARRALAMLDRSASRPESVPARLLLWRGHALALAGEHEAASVAIDEALAMARGGGDVWISADIRREAVFARMDNDDMSGAAELARRSLAEPWGMHAGDILAEPVLQALRDADPGLVAEARRQLPKGLKTAGSKR